MGHSSVERDVKGDTHRHRNDARKVHHHCERNCYRNNCFEDFDCNELPKYLFQEFRLQCWMCSTTGAGASSPFLRLSVAVVFVDVCECGVVVVSLCVVCGVCCVVMVMVRETTGIE